jgi:hypothetical protein
MKKPLYLIGLDMSADTFDPAIFQESQPTISKK